MQNNQLRELTIVLTQRIRENALIDWAIKESARAKLRVIVKRTYGNWLPARYTVVGHRNGADAGGNDRRFASSVSK